jgi:hypothetical protein
METRVAGVTVSVAVPVMVPDVAVMVEDPVATLVAKPAALIAATATAEDDHVTLLVRFDVVLSVKVPVAVNC